MLFFLKHFLSINNVIMYILILVITRVIHLNSSTIRSNSLSVRKFDNVIICMLSLSYQSDNLKNK